jgi:hypothetical protein
MKLNERIIIIIAAAMASIAGHVASVGVGVTPGPAGSPEAVALQLAELLTLGSALEVAVTVMVVEAPAAAQLGTVTVSVAPPGVPAARVSEFGEILGDHPAPPENLRSKVSVAPPVFVILMV